MKRLLSVSLLIFCCCFLSCKHDDGIYIKGDVKGIGDRYVYLYRNFSDHKPIDSVRATDGKFEFSLHPDTSFTPVLAYITYADEKNKQQNLAVINPYETKGDEVHLYADFLLEKGEITLTGDLAKKRGGVTLANGTQNDFTFKNITLPYIRISGDTNRRAAQFNRIKKLVADKPDAYWVMYAMSNLKYSFNKSQVSAIYNGFDKGLRQSYEGRKLKQFLDERPATEDQFFNSVFADKDGRQVNLVDSTKKLNMVVFWASWCGPCRREIPGLKKIASEFNDTGLRLVSVSIDKDKAAWLKAMEQENMSWQQLIVPKADFSTAEARYNLGSIPQIYLVSNKNHIVKKVMGFSEGNEAVMKTFIRDYLAKN
ncbi:hypothetical protein GCM10023149_52090 [Mucilaginibacter gynuensis]|uniref:Thioredoxin domain-containing protein n=1 Tax=Mucilaginibacter gynuensis TaxID=1302236 RepID=A0ABP8HKM1_9SPHI